MKKLFKRSITGAVYVAVVVAALAAGSEHAFMAVFALLAILGVNELHNIARDKSAPTGSSAIIKTIDLLGAAAIFTGAFAVMSGRCLALTAALPVLAYFIVRMVTQLYIRSTNPLKDLAVSALCMAYVAAPVALLNVTYFRHSPQLLLAALILIWVNDTGAYCVGSLLGRHRLFLKVSPKKSWEGFWGGMAFCVVTALIFNHLNEYFGDMSLACWIGYSLIVALFATWGDLCESLIKRTMHVKDSGNLLPGHGGILDRIDSLLIVSPAILIYLTLLTRLAAG